MAAYYVHYIVKKVRTFYAPSVADAVLIAKETLPLTDGDTAQIVQTLAEGVPSLLPVDDPNRVKTVG